MTLRFPFAAATLCLSLPAAGATWTVDKLVDVNTLVERSGQIIYRDEPSIVLSAGDHLQLTFQFLPGQRLEVRNPTEISGLLMGEDAYLTSLSFSHSLTFIDAMGPLQNVGPVDSGSGGAVWSFFQPSSFLTSTSPTDVSFAGVRFDIDVQSFWDGLSSQTYNMAALVVGGSQVAAVPEPSSYVLAAFGLAGVAMASRRRRRLDPS